MCVSINGIVYRLRYDSRPEGLLVGGHTLFEKSIGARFGDTNGRDFRRRRERLA